VRDVEEDGLIMLMRFLRTDTRVVTLNLDNAVSTEENEFGGPARDWVVELGEALRVNQTLQTLDLTLCDVNDADEEALVTGLRLNTTLTELSLDGNIIHEFTGIAGLLRTNTSLQILNISDNRPSDAAKNALADALRINTCLRTFFMEDTECALTNATALAFAAAFNINQSLRIVHIIGWELDDQASILALVDTTRHNLQLTLFVTLDRAKMSQHTLETILAHPRFHAILHERGRTHQIEVEEPLAVAQQLGPPQWAIDQHQLAAEQQQQWDADLLANDHQWLAEEQWDEEHY
jgi:hypothetical protein